MPDEILAVVNDLHCPHHDEAAIEAALSVLQAVQPDLLVFAGDLTDFKPLSRFDRAPMDTLTLQADLAVTKEVMLSVRQALPQTRLVFIKGNHEDRLERWLWKHPEVSVLECLKLENLLDLAAIDCELVEEGHLLFHSWLIVHGDLVRAQAGNTAQAMIQKWGRSGISGHTHRLAQVQKTNYSHEFTWIENGCLCSLSPDYMSCPDWQQGFTILDWCGERVWPTAIPIHSGEARYQGLTFPTNS